MKAIMVMFDSLNRRMLPPYGARDTVAPNFARLAERTVTFDNAYVGSMPCMPARRDLHTGRYNFLHRSWGPLEPFDVSMPEILRDSGVYTHLITDHYHYWEDGGATYHNRYSSYELVRGQEGDAWKGQVADPVPPENSWNRVDPDDPEGPNKRQDWINRAFTDTIETHPQGRVFRLAEEFLERNHSEDDWFLQIEAFDPHEPFFAPRSFRDRYPEFDFDNPHFDWPLYREVSEPPEVARQAVMNYRTVVAMCDYHVGRVIDFMDRHAMWDDTMLIVNTDHGFLLGEHGWWAKVVQPFYNEVAQVPLFVWDPRSARRGDRSTFLAQMRDMAPTLLDLFNREIPDSMTGTALGAVLEGARVERPAVLFGLFGAHVNVTDGRYVYMRAPATPDNVPLYEYTLMATRHGTGNASIARERLEGMTAYPGDAYTDGCPVMRIPGNPHNRSHEFGTLLFDLKRDPRQQTPIEDPDVEQAMAEQMVGLMQREHAPDEQFERLGLDVPVGEGSLRRG